MVMGFHGERMVMFFRLVLDPLGQYIIAESSECVASVPVDNRLPCDPYCRPGFEDEMAPEGEPPFYRPSLSMPDVLRCSTSCRAGGSAGPVRGRWHCAGNGRRSKRGGLANVYDQRRLPARQHG